MIALLSNLRAGLVGRWSSVDPCVWVGTAGWALAWPAVFPVKWVGMELSFAWSRAASGHVSWRLAVDAGLSGPRLCGQLDYAPLGVFAVLEVQRELHRPWTPLSCLRRTKLYSFIFGLAVIFLIMASYVLSNERKGLLLTPSPYHADSSLNLGTLPFNYSSKDPAHMAQVLSQILSKVEFSPRKLPDLKMLVHSEPHMFSVIPRRFLPDVKNPCWYEQLSGNVSADPYRRNLYSLYSRQSRATFQYLRSSFRKHLLLRDRRFYRIRCLPYFYIIGQPKCGTTDLYDRLRLHPDVRVTALKEPHWWTRKRAGEDGLWFPWFHGSTGSTSDLI
ncbi:hypothetical protein NFI96_029507 [Prochilodus magdalenae]|nr:hypothetical protein NFI96_029507 [Prochilodus magdalenae]